MRNKQWERSSQKAADSMSTMKFRMVNADKAFCMDLKFPENRGIAEGRKHKGYREVVQAYILHSCQCLSCNNYMFDAHHGWKSKNLDCMKKLNVV